MNSNSACSQTQKETVRQKKTKTVMPSLCSQYSFKCITQNIVSSLLLFITTANQTPVATQQVHAFLYILLLLSKLLI